MSRPWGDIKLSAQRARLLGVLTFRRWVLEDLAFNDWLDADYEQYLIEQLPVERARLLRVLDARFAQLYSEGLENEAMYWFRTDFVRVLAAREEQLFWERMRQQQERIDKLKADFERALEMGHDLLRRAYRQDLVRVLRARIRDLFPKAIVCPECAKRGLHAEAADPRCELCRGGWLVWEYRVRMANGYELRAWSNVDHASEARARALKG